MSDDSSQFSFMGIKHTQLRMKSREAGVQGAQGWALTGSSGPTVLGSTLLTSGA